MTAIRTGVLGNYTDGGNGFLPMEILEANALTSQEMQALEQSTRLADGFNASVVPMPATLNGETKGLSGDLAPVNPVTPLTFDNDATIPRRGKDHTELDKAHIFMTQPGSSLHARLYNLFILACVVIGVLCTCFQSIWTLQYAWTAFMALQIVTSLILLADFATRFYVYPGVPKARFWQKPENILYLIGIVSAWIAIGVGWSPMSVIASKPVLEAFLALSLLRLVYLYQSFSTIQLLIRVLGRARDGVFAAIILFMTMVVVYSTIFFYVETGTGGQFDEATGVWNYYPWVLGSEDEPAVVQNIVDSWWLLGVTMVTVGYGDVSPKTIGGKVVMGFAFLTILVMFPLPGALIAATLVDMYNEDRQLRDELMKEFDVNNDGKLDLNERIAIQKEMDRRRQARKAMEKEMKTGKKKMDEDTNTTLPGPNAATTQAIQAANQAVPQTQTPMDLLHMQGRMESMHIRMDMMDQKLSNIAAMLQQLTLK